MATRAHKQMANALVRSFKVGTGVTKGKLVKFGADDDHVTDCAAGEQGIGIALETSGVAEADCQIALLAGASIVPVLVGTGGAARGGYAVVVANGLATQAIATGTNARHIAGIFMQTGVAGDFVGLLCMPGVVFTA